MGVRTNSLLQRVGVFLKGLDCRYIDPIGADTAAPSPTPKRQQTKQVLMNPSVAWTKHLRDSESIERFRGLILGSGLVLERLAELCEEKLKSREVFKEEDYKDPSWAYRCADRTGYTRAFREIITLLKGVDHDTTAGAK